MRSKWLDRGFWVSQHFYWQSMVHYLWYSGKNRSFTFFSAANPTIPFGGMLDESKSHIDAIIPPKHKPKTTVYKPLEDLEFQLKNADIGFPFIIKPDIGLQGQHIYKVHNLEEAQDQLAALDTNRQWLLQEYLDYKSEYALLVAKWPASKQTKVLSLIEKKYPSVEGDGSSTMKTLILKHPHPFLRRKRILNQWKSQWNYVPESGKTIVIDYVGNYCRGASFHSLMETIDDRFSLLCAKQLDQFEHLYFYRLDLKADTISSITDGNFKVIEVNGAKSEPLHIYDKRHGFWENTKHIKRHWQTLNKISSQNIAKGTSLPSFSEGIHAARSIKRMLAT